MYASLRSAKASDAEELYSVIESNREHLQNLAWVKEATLESTTNFLESIPSDEMFFLIDIGGKIAGTITLRPYGNEKLLGYWLAYEHRSHGAMTLMVRDMMVLLPEGTMVVAHINRTNIASQRVLEHNRFTAHDDGDIMLEYRRVIRHET